MSQKVIVIGNSLAVTIPKESAQELRIGAGDRVEVHVDSERKIVSFRATVTGLSAKDYFINGVSLRVKPNNAIETEWNVARREMQSWIVGVAGYSEVGETTMLGY